MSENDGIYFLNWSAPVVKAITGQSVYPVAYDQVFGAITLHGKGQYGELAEPFSLKMEEHYNMVKKSAPDTTALIVSHRKDSKAAIRSLQKIRREVAEREDSARRKKRYGG